MHIYPLSRSGVAFAATFPSVELNRSNYNRALEVLRVHHAEPLRKRLGAFAFEMFARPPVDDMLLPFIHAMLVRAATVAGASTINAELCAASVINEITAEAPLAGLTVSIGAPRKSIPIDQLERCDTIIEDIHGELLNAAAIPVGPQEHPGKNSTDTPAHQWRGHVSAACSPTVSHDAYVALAGPSVGVGESLALAHALQIPIASVELHPNPFAPHDGTPSCRAVADDYASPIIDQVDDADVPHHVVAALAAIAPKIRSAQRKRIKSIAADSQYRQYLMQRASPPPVALSDPFRFAAMTDIEREAVAAGTNGLTREGYTIYSNLPTAVRTGFDRFLLTPDAPTAADANSLLREGSRALAAQGADLRAQRHTRWESPDTWWRLFDEIDH